MSFTILSGTEVFEVSETARTREEALHAVRLLLRVKRPNIRVFDDDVRAPLSWSSLGRVDDSYREAQAEGDDPAVGWGRQARR